MLFQALNIARPDLLGKTANNFNACQVTLMNRAVKALSSKGLLMHGAVGVAVEETAQFVF